MERESEVVIIPPEGANGPTKGSHLRIIFPKFNPRFDFIISLTSHTVVSKVHVLPEIEVA